MTARPDIVLLVLDTQRADRLSCYNPQLATSPRLDQFAADATLFQHAIAPAQWTVPSHASMFTGRYSATHQTLQSNSVLPTRLPTLAERLAAGGYFTAAFCNNPLVGVVNNGLQRGFYSFLNYSGLLTSRPNQTGARSRLLDRYRQLFKRTLGGLIHRAQDAFARSDWLLAFSFTPFMVPIWQTALSFKGNTARSLEDAARLMVQRKGVAPDQPIFSFINVMGAHMPYHPPRRYAERLAPHVVRNSAARRYLRRFNSDIYGWLAPLERDIDAERKATLDGMYNAEVAYQAELVGLFLEKLRASGKLDTTLVMICADHGNHLGEKQMVGHSFSLYDDLVRVPLIVRDPSGSLPHGSEVPEFVSTRRIFHTALAAAGLATDDERPYHLAQRGANDPDGATVFSEAVPPQDVLNILLRRRPELMRERHCDQTRRAVMNGNHKLIVTGERQLELFDVYADPAETLNLAAMLPERADELRDQLDTFVRGTGAIAPPIEQAVGNDDPLVQRRLRDLGYLE